MSNISINAKGEKRGIALRSDLYSIMDESRIDRTETCFGGKVSLTEERYSDAMQQVDLMRSKSSW